MANQTKTFEAQMAVARTIMERRREVFAALANPYEVDVRRDCKADVEAARARLDKYKGQADGRSRQIGVIQLRLSLRQSPSAKCRGQFTSFRQHQPCGQSAFLRKK